jgi:flagellar basal body-associated protein FliL
MPEETNPPGNVDEPSAEQAAEQPKRGSLLARFLKPKWLLVLLAVSVAGHALGFAYFRLTANHSAALGPEVSLGKFRFVADAAEDGHYAAAEFSLHIALLGQVEASARRELEAKRFRVQEAVEELIRRAHSGDFDDPLLTGLKQQLQEAINEALGVRVISEVIITDLALERKGQQPGMVAESPESLPWPDLDPQQPSPTQQASHQP